MTQQAETPALPACSRCKTRLLRSDRYCRGCGKDLCLQPWPGPARRRVPRSLQIAQFQDPGDLAASRALALAYPVRLLVRQYLQRIAEPDFRTQLLGSSVRVGPGQFPKLHRQVRFAERVLHAGPVEVYVASSAEASTTLFGSGSSNLLIITTAAVSLLDENEMLFAIGSQLGHVKADHVVYLTVARALTTALKGLPGLGSSLSGMASYLLVPWERQAVLTADRAGLLCCQDPTVAATSLLKLALGSPSVVKDTNMDGLLEQADRLEAQGDWGDAWKPTPALVRRIQGLARFFRSEQWDAIFDGAWDPRAPRFRCWFCPSGGSPSGPGQALSTLECEECRRNLMIDEVLCPGCAGPIPTDSGSSLSSLRCDACDRPYLEPDETLQATRDTPGSPDGSAYSVLGIHPTASPREIRRAFRTLMGSLADEVALPGGPSPSQRKIRFFRAYKTVIDPSRRASHDRILRHRQDLAQAYPGTRAFPTCPACEGPMPDPFCGLCGASRARDQEERSRMTQVRQELERLAAEDLGELAADPQGAFQLAFHARSSSFYFKGFRELVRPGPIREYLLAARSAHLGSTWGRKVRCWAIVEGEVDLDLATSLLAEARQEFGMPDLEVSVLHPGDDQSLVSVTLPGGNRSDDRHPEVSAWIAGLLPSASAP